MEDLALAYDDYQQYFKITMLKTSPLILIILLVAVNCQISPNQAIQMAYQRSCLAFKAGYCVTCPLNYHMSQNQCYLNITGCLQYATNSSGMQICSKCDPAISNPDGNGGCSLTVSLQQLQNNAYLQQVAANYGDLRFQPITVDAAFADRYFQIANTFMLTGNYKHFITASPNKQVQSVATFTLGNLRQFKILYSGSGGGLMLCLVSVDITTNLPILSSFVSIGTTDIVDNCDQYSLNTKCESCQDGYHLQNSLCYMNIQNCISYSRNICLQCNGFSYLIQNRCLTTCSQTADLAQMQFFNDFRMFSSTSVLIISRSYLLA